MPNKTSRPVPAAVLKLRASGTDYDALASVGRTPATAPPESLDGLSDFDRAHAAGALLTSADVAARVHDTFRWLIFGDAAGKPRLKRINAREIAARAIAQAWIASDGSLFPGCRSVAEVSGFPRVRIKSKAVYRNFSSARACIRGNLSPMKVGANAADPRRN